jgi:hypothetical protein
MLLLLLACPRLAEEPDPPGDSGSVSDSGQQDSDDTGPAWPDPECAELVWHEGDLVLESAEDWGAFCAAGYNAVRGDLMAEDIALREPCLCEVSGHVDAYVRYTVGDGASREGLTQLRSVGSMVAVLYDVDLPRLERAEAELYVGFVYQAEAELGVIEAGELAVSGSTVRLPRLERADDLELWADQAYVPALVEVGHLRSLATAQLDLLEQAGSITWLDSDLVAPRLHTVGTLRFENTVHDATPLSSLRSVQLLEVDASETNGHVVWVPEMPALEALGELDLQGCNEEIFSAFGALKRVEGRLRLNRCEGDMSALVVEQVGSLVLREIDDELVFPGSLVRIDDKLVIEDNLETRAIDGLEGVVELAGKLRIENNRYLGGLDGLGGLERVGGDLVIQGNGSLSQAEAEAFAAALEVGGSVTVEGNWDE